MIYLDVNVLFVCSRNKWRSRTAEDLFKDSNVHNVRSAGTAPVARIKISEKLLSWAEIIFVMEKRHREQLKSRFPLILDEKEVIVLDIPDEYGYMDDELVELLKASVSRYLEL
ncbi:putative protein tyrosine phosphatase [Pedobacter africanus]|uniref:Protein-tyrosine phosphatase n=1 Tax=Pedobacter africanus TaxID=151894 RepID=A0ACC6KZM1_9SPHI|nr:protein tyrosine phosphatase [Pedobacter africanus]MDR6784605.1 protein-tyrosine phosphatase [Pedobacter africanus]